MCTQIMGIDKGVARRKRARSPGTAGSSSGGVHLLVKIVFEEPEVYSDVSRRVFEFLVHDRVNQRRSIRWNVMRKWIDGNASDGAARVTKASREFMSRGRAPFVQQLRQTICAVNPSFRNVLFPRQARALLELLMTSHVCEALDDPQDLTLWAVDGFVSLDKPGFASVTFHPRCRVLDSGLESSHSGRFVAAIRPEVISKAFLEVELKHAATNPVLMVITKSHLEIVRRGSLLACIPFCRVLLDSDDRAEGLSPGIGASTPMVETGCVEHVRRMCELGCAHELVRMQHDDGSCLRHAVDGIDRVRELAFDQVRRFLPEVGMAISIPGLRDQYHFISAESARAAFQWLSIPIRLTSSSSARAGGRMWPKRMRAQQHHRRLFARGEDAMGILTQRTDERALIWIRYIPSEGCIKMLAFGRVG